MTSIRPHSVGLTLGLFIALWHVLWASLVWKGVAQALIDFVFRLHMIEPPYRITAFSFATATLLVVVTGVIGCASGWMIAVIWNGRVRRSTAGS